MDSLTNIIQAIVVYALPVLFAITAHEAAHGFVAQKLGDNTAAMLGRVTLNPVKHIDPIGTVLIPLALALLTKGAFLFGYAKPVPVRLDRLKNPRRDMILVALAGPLCNLVQALVWKALFYLLHGIGVHEPFFLAMAQGGAIINVVLCVFNLFPLPPLDGGRVLMGLLPPKAAMTLRRVEPYGFFIVVALLVFPVAKDGTGIISRIWLEPLTNLFLAAINLILFPLRALLG